MAGTESLADAVEQARLGRLSATGLPHDQGCAERRRHGINDGAIRPKSDHSCGPLLLQDL